MNEPLDPGPTETRQHWQIVQQLREKLADIEARTMMIIAERDKAIAERDNLRELLRAECENFDGECAGTCDSFSHDEDCRFCTFANDHRGLKKELAETRSRLVEIDLCRQGQSPCEWATILIAERCEALADFENANAVIEQIKMWLDDGCSIKRMVVGSPTLQHKNGEWVIQNLHINGEPTP